MMRFVSVRIAIVLCIGLRADKDQHEVDSLSLVRKSF